jgi:hypothetical protein
MKHTNGQQVHEEMLNITNYQGKANENLKETSPHPSKNDSWWKCKLLQPL